MRFKVGDKVRLISKVRYACIREGTKAEIDYIDGYKIRLHNFEPPQSDCSACFALEQDLLSLCKLKDV